MNALTTTIAVVGAVGYIVAAISYVSLAWHPVKRHYSQYGKPREEEMAAMKLTAYHRTLAAPIWPVMFINDTLAGYREAKMLSQPYFLDQQRKQLEKAQKYANTLEQAQQEAQKAIKRSLS